MIVKNVKTAKILQKIYILADSFLLRICFIKDRDKEICYSFTQYTRIPYLEIGFMILSQAFLMNEMPTCIKLYKRSLES